MSLFKDLLNLWRAKDLLHQAWSESIEMLELSRDIFKEAIIQLREHSNRETLIELKSRDKAINEYHRTVRRKVLTHYSVNQDTSDFNNGLILVNMVVDIERIGDYAKNILELAMYHPNKIISEEISPELYKIEDAVSHRFDSTLEAIKEQDPELAQNLKESYKVEISALSDDIVNKILANEIHFDNESRAAAIALYARYLKRIGSHLKNITSVLVNPFDSIGYME